MMPRVLTLIIFQIIHIFHEVWALKRISARNLVHGWGTETVDKRSKVRINVGKHRVMQKQCKNKRAQEIAAYEEGARANRTTFVRQFCRKL